MRRRAAFMPRIFGTSSLSVTRQRAAREGVPAVRIDVLTSLQQCREVQGRVVDAKVGRACASAGTTRVAAMSARRNGLELRLYVEKDDETVLHVADQEGAVEHEHKREDEVLHGHREIEGLQRRCGTRDEREEKVDQQQGNHDWTYQHEASRDHGIEQAEKQTSCFATEQWQEAANRPDAVAVVDSSQREVKAAG